MGKCVEVIFSWLRPEFAHESTQWYCHLDIVHLKIPLFWIPFSLQTLFCVSWDWKCTESKSLWKLNLYQHCLQTLFEFKPILDIFTIFTKIKEEWVSLTSFVDSYEMLQRLIWVPISFLGPVDSLTKKQKRVVSWWGDAIMSRPGVNTTSGEGLLKNGVIIFGGIYTLPPRAD